MDADDVCRPTRFERQVAFMENHPLCAAVGSYAEYMDADGSPIYVVQRPTEHKAIDEMHLGGVGGAILHPSAILRTNALRQIGGYRPELEPAEDTDMFLRLAERGRLSNLPEVLLNYRFNQTSICFTRMEVQSKRLQCAIADARNRRGLPQGCHVSKLRRFSRTRYEGSIIYHSLRAGHVRTSVKHLLAVLGYFYRGKA
jgi:hypothetical protein